MVAKERIRSTKSTLYIVDKSYFGVKERIGVKRKFTVIKRGVKFAEIDIVFKAFAHAIIPSSSSFVLLYKNACFS